MPFTATPIANFPDVEVWLTVGVIGTFMTLDCWAMYDGSGKEVVNAENIEVYVPVIVSPLAVKL
jgi:hypothetical protein